MPTDPWWMSFYVLPPALLVWRLPPRKWTCVECGVEEGRLHCWGCPVEQCPWCLDFLTTCGCVAQVITECLQRVPLARALSREALKRWGHEVLQPGGLYQQVLEQALGRVIYLRHYPGLSLVLRGISHGVLWGEALPTDADA